MVGAGMAESKNRNFLTSCGLSEVKYLFRQSEVQAERSFAHPPRPYFISAAAVTAIRLRVIAAATQTGHPNSI
jgi:hypothetical protein